MMSILRSGSAYLARKSGISISNSDKSLGHLYAFPIPSGGDVLSVGLPPRQGPRHISGDRPCVHVNFKGSVEEILPPISNGLHDFGNGLILPGLRIGTSSEYYVVLQAGDEFTPPAFTKPAGALTYIYRNRLIKLSGNPGMYTVTNRWTKETWYQGKIYSTSTTNTTYRHECSWSGKYETFVAVTRRYVNGSATPDSSFEAVYALTQNTATRLTEEAIISRFNIISSMLADDAPLPPANFHNKLALDTVEACRVLNLNALALTKDLLSLHTVATWARSIPQVSSFGDGARAYLGFQYGAPLTTKDVLKTIRSLARSFRKKTWRGHSTARSRSSFSAPSILYQATWQWDANMRIIYDPVDTLGASTVRSLYDFGLFPSAKNLWDFIPYSFVLGWAVNVDDYLAKIDADAYLHTVNILGVTSSDRLSITLPATAIDSSLKGTFEMVYYTRQVSLSVGLDDPSFQITNPSNNLVEGGALILARRK